MSDLPPVTAPPPLPGRRKRYEEMARASWIAPIICFVLNWVVMAGLGKDSGGAKVQMIVGPLFILIGLIFGVVALFGVRKYGTAGILSPAIAGVVINLSLIALGMYPLIYFNTHRVHLRPAVHSPSAHLLTNDRLHFSMDIPPGFQELPGARQSPTIEHLYVKGEIAGGQVLTVINIERLGGLIPRGKPLTKEALPPGFQGELTTRNWRGATVDAFIASVEQRGAKVVVYTIQIPLKPTAIQLSVGGPATDRVELSKLADTLLASLDGETNW